MLLCSPNFSSSSKAKLDLIRNSSIGLICSSLCQKKKKGNSSVKSIRVGFLKNIRRKLITLTYNIYKIMQIDNRLLLIVTLKIVTPFYLFFP